MDRINRYFGYRAIETLKIIQAPLKKSATSPAKPIAADGATPPPPLLDVPFDVSALDGGLKAALSTLWASVQRDRPKR